MQELTQRLVQPGTKEYEEVKALYDEAFSGIDDLDDMAQAIGTGKAALYAYDCGEGLAAFTLVLLPGHYCYVLYSALAKQYRHKGLIRVIIDHLRKTYPDRPFVFDIETPNEAAPDAKERQYRYEMFTHLGFRDTGFGMSDASGEYTIFCERDFDEKAFRESWDILPEEFGSTIIVPR